MQQFHNGQKQNEIFQLDRRFSGCLASMIVPKDRRCVRNHIQKGAKIMRFGKASLATAAAVALAGAPVVAQTAAPAKPVAAKVQRAGASKEESKLGGGSGVIVAVVAAAAVIAGIVIAAGNDDDAPTSN
jgi:hypothetical protein